jgi:hypothetical protein
MEALLLVAESSGPTMFARIGVMRALNRHVERKFNPDRKDPRWVAASWREIYDYDPREKHDPAGLCWGANGAVLTHKAGTAHLGHCSAECGTNLSSLAGCELIWDNWCDANVRLFRNHTASSSRLRGLSATRAVIDFLQGASARGAD